VTEVFGCLEITVSHENCNYEDGNIGRILARHVHLGRALAVSAQIYDVR
jgi:hypothetical protein